MAHDAMRGIEPCSAEFAFQTLRFFVTKSPSPKISIRPLPHRRHSADDQAFLNGTSLIHLHGHRLRSTALAPLRLTLTKKTNRTTGACRANFVVISKGEEHWIFFKGGRKGTRRTAQHQRSRTRPALSIPQTPRQTHLGLVCP